MKMIVSTLLGILFLGLVGCASLPELEDKNGISRTYKAPFAEVGAAAQASIEARGTSIERVADEDGKLRKIWFKKPLSVFSWGEIGLVRVMDQGAAGVVVDIRSEANRELKAGSAEQDQFVDSLFAGIEKGLATPGQ